MKFKVEWTDDAKLNLAQLYLTASDRRRFSAAADRIDIILEKWPIAAGKAVVGNRRCLIEWPLYVHFDVFLDDERVEVLSIKSFRPEM